MSKGDVKFIYYVAPPPIDNKLTAYDLKLLDVIKELGEASVNDLLMKFKPDYKDIPKPLNGKTYSFKERWQIVKRQFKLSTTMADMIVSIQKLKKCDCIRTLGKDVLDEYKEVNK